MEDQNNKLFNDLPSALLSANRRHMRHLQVFACLAFIVALGVPFAMRQQGMAMATTKTLLECHYAGNGAHTHNADCYDESGNLVCPLVEKPFHTHTADCYATERVLSCTLPETDGHAHTDECYDDEGTLICGLEETPGHAHTDACYETRQTDQLICGFEETTEEHVHGPGCFKTITVADDGSEQVTATEAAANLDDSMPAQVFDDDLKDADDKVVLHVHVEAPEGAFPKGTTMRIKPVDPNDIQGAVDDAVAQKTDAKVMDIQAVDITFYDKDGQEIEPATNITVALTSDLIAQNDDSYIVHVDDKGQGDVVNTLNDDQIYEHDMTPEDNQVVFDSDKFSTYTIVITSLHGTLNASDGNAYNIDVEVPAAAGIPQGAELEAREITESDEGYDVYLAEAGNAFEGDVTYARFFDISIVKDGAKVQPEEPVQVKISLLDESENLSDTVKVLHFGEDGAVAETLDATLNGDTVSFDANGFSVYAVVDEGDDTNHARMEVNFYGKGSTLIATMYVKNDDTAEELVDILYDPGAGSLSDREVFMGWTTNPDYTVADGENSLDIVQIREQAADKTITEDDKVNYYAIILDTVSATYLDEKGISMGSQNAYMRWDEDSAGYTVNMSYTPPDDIHNFEGWNVSEGSSNIVGYTEGAVYENGTDITLTGDVTFSVNAPEGHWLVFDENGKGATYNAPRFIKSEEATTAPSDPVRLGYTFGGWYTLREGEADETGYTPVVESSKFIFGSTISNRTTLYAKWIPVTEANYTVIIWRQNLEANGYDFAESISLQGTTNSNINTVVQRGTDDDAYVSVNGEEKQYTGFHLKEFDQNVKITPEGDAVLNVYYDRNVYTLRFYYARSYVFNNRTYVQVNVNDEGFLQGRRGGRNVNQSLTTVVTNDYGFFGGGNTWKDVNVNGMNGDATRLITDDYKQKVTLGSENIGNYYTYVVSDNYTYENNNRATRSSVNMTYYYFDVNVYFGQSLVDVWPVPSQETYNVFNGSGYNTRSSNDGQPATGIGLPIRPIHQGFYATGNGVSGLYSTVDSAMFVGNSKTAYFITYWRFQSATEIAYRSYFSVLEDETPDVYYHGNGYKLHETFTALTGEGWFTNGRATDNGRGWDIGTVSYDGTEYASGDGYVGRVDGQSPNVINAYYDRIVRHVNFYDGIYVDGNGNTIQNKKDIQLHTQAVTFGEELATFNEDGEYYYRPNDTNEYVFEGWYLDPEGQQPYTFSGTMPMHDVTVYAKWRQVEYRVFLHPNTTDPSLDWGSSAQAMNFRVSYGDKVSAPMGTRNDYEFVGWYTDPSCSANSLFNADATELNEITVTAYYDKTIDMTDPMDKWGQGATTNADVDRFWITKKLDLYAKWRAKLTGAEGIGVIYDAKRGSNPPYDKSLYLDQAEATAQAASTAPTDEVFKHWVVQRWDETERKYVDSDRIVYPGDLFTVRMDDARRTENQDHTPENPSYTYTVQLRAEYGELGEGTPTHIFFYANTCDKDGNAIPSVTTDDQPKDETSYKTIDINKAYPVLSIDDVLNGDTRYSNYKFLGWAKEADATEPWLKLNDNGTYTVNQDDQTYTNVTKIAADERTPYEDLYAVWEREPDIKVYKNIAITEKGQLAGLSKNDINMTIYFILKYHESGDGHQAGDIVKDDHGEIIWRSIQLVNGVPTPEFVGFSGIPAGSYEVWECYDATGSPLNAGDVFDADGVRIDDHELAKFQLDHVDAFSPTGANNNVTITGGETQSVSFTNTYTDPNEFTQFVVNKQWIGRGGRFDIIGPPEGKHVTMTLYKVVDGQEVPVTDVDTNLDGVITEADGSIDLDGTPDELQPNQSGEIEAWRGAFRNLPRLDEHGERIVYKVKETYTPAGFYPYKARGEQEVEAMGEGFLENSGGTIYNRRLTVTIQLQKHWDFQPNSGREFEISYEAFLNDKATQRILWFELTLPEGITTDDLVAELPEGVHPSEDKTKLVMTLADFTRIKAGTELDLDIPYMPAGTYRFEEFDYRDLLIGYNYFFKSRTPETPVEREVNVSENHQDTLEELHIHNQYVMGNRTKVQNVNKKVTGLTQGDWEANKDKFNQLHFIIKDADSYYAGQLPEDQWHWDPVKKRVEKYRWVTDINEAVRFAANFGGYNGDPTQGWESGNASLENPPELYPGHYELIEVEAQEDGAAQIDGYTLEVKGGTLDLTIDTDEEKMNQITSLTITVTNEYTPLPKQPIEFEKVDQVESTKILAGAEFTMVGPGIDGETYTLVSTDGTFKAKKGSEEVTEFDYGEYTITETKAPAGYLPMTGTVTVTVNADGVTYQQTDNHSNEPIPAEKANEDSPYVVIITNNPGKVLPHTGGPGTAINGILGTALIVGALMYGMVSRRTRERRSDA